ncbi:unnamed protein product [Larinioides sclopetarius]|uniref:Uncharacterized protein n=1 Tax=Larinioides sclopetarius TaxID=280406 RepID=A0AAV1Z4B6_9ARAC
MNHKRTWLEEKTNSSCHSTFINRGLRHPLEHPSPVNCPGRQLFWSKAAGREKRWFKPNLPQLRLAGFTLLRLLAAEQAANSGVIRRAISSDCGRVLRTHAALEPPKSVGQ